MVVSKRFSLYSVLDRTPARYSYSAKMLVATLIATLAPIAILSSALLAGHAPMSTELELLLIGVTVLASLCFTVCTVRTFVRPVEQLAAFVEKYVSTGVISDLPEELHDDLGALMRDTRNTVLKLHISTKELAEAGKVDTLTGLHNRRFCAQRLQQDLARAGRSDTPVSLVAVDIDNFRRLNDKHGAAVGDVCLTHFADLLKASIREGDWIARWGGDEFLILLWDADGSKAETVIDRIRYKLAHSQAALEAGIRMSASFGFTSHAPGDVNYDMFAKADAALYKAKRLGMNQSVASASLAARQS